MLGSAERPAVVARCEKLGDAGTVLTGFSAAVVATGEISARSSDGERMRLVAGDAITVGCRMRCGLLPRTSPSEILLLEADAAWTEATLRLAPESVVVAERVGVSRAASPMARRARQILRGLVLPGAAGPRSEALRAASAAAELLALSLDAPSDGIPPAAPTHAGAATRGAFAAALASLGESGSLEELTLGSLASRLGLSERQVSRLFRLELGTTFTDHVTRLRVDRARRLLDESALPVIEVAAETGWSSLAHFNAVFRRHTGHTPTAYRARLRRVGAPMAATLPAQYEG